MDEKQIISARQKAERAVKGMKDEPLRIAAFQAILARLLADGGRTEQAEQGSSKQESATSRDPNTLRGRVLAIRSEGFFKSQRTLGEVRKALGSRGWHYPLTTLSGLMQGLVRKRELRREWIATGSKGVWKYSNP
jgi:hypothetical protein